MKQPDLAKIAFAVRSQDGGAINLAIQFANGQKASVAFEGKELAKILPAIKETVTTDCRNSGKAAPMPVKDIKVSTDWPDSTVEGFTVWFTDINGFDTHFRLTLEQIRGLAATCLLYTSPSPRDRG